MVGRELALFWEENIHSQSFTLCFLCEAGALSIRFINNRLRMRNRQVEKNMSKYNEQEKSGEQDGRGRGSDDLDD